MRSEKNRWLFVGKQLSLAFAVCIALNFAAHANARSDDEAALRALAEKFFEAHQKRDLDALMLLWSQKSPNLASNKQAFQQAFASGEKIELKSLVVSKVTLDGDKATVSVVAEVSAAGANSNGPARFAKTSRTLHCVKEGTVWRVWSYVSGEEELAAALASAKTDEGRKRLIEQGRELVTIDLQRALLKQGDSLLVQSSYAQAIAIYTLAQEIAEQLNDRQGIVQVLGSLGNAHTYQANYAQALEYYERSLKLSQEIGSKAGIAKALGRIGAVHTYQANYAQAIEYYQRGLKLNEELGNKIGVANALANLGTASSTQGNYKEGVEYYQRSLKVNEELDNKIGVANVLGNTGNVYFEQASYALALGYYQRCLALCEELGHKYGVAIVLTNIAQVYVAQADPTQALIYAERATSIAKEIGTPEWFWEARNTAGEAYRLLNKPEQARQSFDEAITAIEQLRNQVVGGGQDQQRFFEAKIKPYYNMVALLISQNRPAQALTYAERAKARVLLDVLRSGRTPITKAMTDKEQRRERELDFEIVSINSQISIERQRQRPDPAVLSDLDARLQKARLEYEAFQTGLYVAHPELKTQRGQIEPATLERASALLPDAETALVEFAVGLENTYLFVLTKDARAGRDDRAKPELRVYSIAIKADELAKQVERFRVLLATGNLDFQDPARQLYKLFLKPAERQLQGKSTLCIVPDGALWELPFQSLQPRAGGYLLQQYAISYVPSLSVLAEMVRLAGQRDSSFAGPYSLLAFGNPALSRETINRANANHRDENLAPLPGAEKEVQTLAQLYGPARSKIFTGAEAREETAKREAGNYHILHFATHGMLDDNSPLYSRVLLSQVKSDTSEDGMLEAREIMQLDLKANIAVLSACQTGRGRVGAGEGVIGMAWAFFIAGCPTTVVSQWKVDSSSTAALMIEFHRHLIRHLTSGGARASKARALQRAALSLLKDKRYSHPFYWAGFIVIGDGT
jgi:CHAT domain-containing protein/ketosteroid isomerase-like protein